MITELDIQAIAEKLDNNSTAGLMMIENLWAKKTQQAMLDANGKLVQFERVPNDVIYEALADIKALATAWVRHPSHSLRWVPRPCLRPTVQNTGE